MQQRGRAPAASAALLQLPNEPRAEPPAELSAEQSELWRRVVNTKPASWFSADSLPLLTQYVRHITTAALLEKRIAALTIDDLDELDYWLRLRNSETKAIIALATAMRLAQNARFDRKAAHTEHTNEGGEVKPWDAVALPDGH